MISELCFMHVPKTGGSSWYKMLESSCGEVELVDRGINHRTLRPTSGLMPTITRIGHETRLGPHVTLPAYRQRRRDTFVVAFVRNPYARLVSAFYFLSRGGQTRQDHADGMHYVSEYQGDFRRFVREGLGRRRDHLTAQIHLKPQYQWLFDGSMHLLADHVGRFERLDSETLVLQERLGLPATPLPHVNRTDHVAWESYYDDGTREITYEAYRRDFELFRYSS